MSYDTNTSLDKALELAKKRAMQFSHMESENGNPAAKRHLASGGGGGRDVHLKLLVPSNVSGHIIGKGGETIAEIRRTSGTHVTMSKNTEVFPGTQDRVVLINGSRDAVADTVQMVVKLIKERLEELGEGDSDKDRTVKVVVTNSTIGMVIGKGGGNVEEMKQRSGANILISKKEDQKVPERLITLVGEQCSNQIALDMILEKIVEDPNSSSCTSINYEGDGGAAGGGGGGFGYAAAGKAAASAGGGGGGGVPGYDTINVNGHTNLRLTLNMHSSVPPDPWVSSQAMPHINYSLRQAGHSDTVADELTRALGLLAAHGVLQLSQSAAKEAAVQGWAGEVGAGNYGYGAAAPAPPGQTKTGLPYPRPATPPGETSGPPAEEEVQVEDRLVGTVIGPGGRTVEEIKQYSGADVQISKRGVFAPGTNNRVITIKGSQRAVQSALYLVQQKIQDKQEDRARSGRS